MKSSRFASAVLLPALLLAVSGCGILLGEADADREVLPPVLINFVETLRSQDSLRGASYREELPGMQSASNALQRPSAVFADQFRVYVTDIYVGPPSISSPRIFIFDRAAATLSIVNTSTLSGRPEGKLLSPSGIVVDQGNTIFVSDSDMGRVFRFDRNGTLLAVLGQQAFGSSQHYASISFPRSLAIDSKRNRIYIADALAVKAFTTSGMSLFEISGGGGKDFRSIDAVAVNSGGEILVLDGIRRRISIFDGEGNFVRSFGLKQALAGRAIRPTGMAVDSDGHLYIPDSFNNGILIFEKDGTFLSTWGRTGVLTGDFWTPAGIFIDERDFIYVVDQMNGRIQTFQYTKKPSAVATGP